ncbi:VapE domain-containing protein [Companilactobacillus formosensis]|uniref:VapE domain-containing protein n=1 Tax=Companilactobacillus formosensis TaxID=1617889 RepID=UPI000E651F0A|nr:VapE domain-containing protein [Companilactobacillus formosensis]
MSVEEKVKKLQKVQEEEKVTSFPYPFLLNQYSKPKANSLKNVGLILERDPMLKGTFAFNEFTHEIEIQKDVKQLNIEKGQMKDDYTPALMWYMESKFEVLFPKNLTEMAVINEARSHSYNPMKDYLEDCYSKWDKKPRLADFLPTFLGVEKSDVTTLQTKLFLVGAVTKVFNPKAKFDYVLDLAGGQGAGKTTLLKKLANGWYTDQFSDFKDKDSYVNMLRAWIVNDDEMTATARSSFEDLKKFASAEKLEFRKAYGRNTTNEYKNFVLARTTNQVQYLKDKTGSRRFLPNLVDKSKQMLHPVEYLDQNEVDQVWGEAMDLFRDGFSFNLSAAEEKMLDEHREQFVYIEPFEEQIDKFLENANVQFITSFDIADQALDIKNLATNPKMAKKIKYVMDNKEGWEYKRKTIKGIKRRGYVKVDH